MKTFQLVAALALGCVMGVVSAPAPAPQDDSIGFGNGGFPDDSQWLGEPTRVVITHPDDSGITVTRTVIITPTRDPPPRRAKTTKTIYTTIKTTKNPTPTPTPSTDCESTTTPSTTKRPKPTATYTEDDSPTITRTVIIEPRI